MARGRGAAALWAVALGAAAIPTAAGADPAGAKPFVVSVLGGGDALSIADALARAPEGTPIVVRTGTYRESLVISRAVDLRADGGDPKDVVVEGTRGPALRSTADGVSVKGMTLRVRKAADAAPEAAVVVGSGAAVLDGCVIASDAGYGVLARSANAKPRLVGCRVVGAPQDCVSVQDGAAVTLESCAVEGAKANGIGVYSGSSVQGKEVTISGCAQEGVAVFEGATLRLEGGRIRDNGARGVVAVNPKTSVVLQNVVFEAGRGNAVLIAGGAQLEAVGCEVSGHAKSGFLLQGEGTRGVLRSCRIHHNKGSGILFEAKSSGLVEDGDVASNVMVGIEVREGSNVVIRRTKVHHQVTGADLACHDPSTTRVEDCELFAGKVTELWAWDGATVDVRGTKFHDGTENGLLVELKAKVTLADVDVSKFKQCGVLADTEGHVEAERSALHDCKWGLGLTGAAVALLTACDVSANSEYSVTVSGKAQLTMNGGKVRDGEKGGLYFEKDGGGTLTAVEISKNKGPGIYILGGAPTVRECKIRKNTGAGVRVERDGGGTFEKCDLADNLGGAWALEDPSRVVRKGNRPAK